MIWYENTEPSLGVCGIAAQRANAEKMTFFKKIKKKGRKKIALSLYSCNGNPFLCDNRLDLRLPKQS